VPLSVIANEKSLKINLISNLTRNPEKSEAEIPQILIDKIFKLSKGLAALARNGEGYTVSRLKKITVAEPFNDKAGVDELSGQLSEDFRRDIQSQLALALRDRFGVKINRDNVSNLFTGAVNRQER
jgi:hypothetical protein